MRSHIARTESQHGRLVKRHINHDVMYMRGWIHRDSWRERGREGGREGGGGKEGGMDGGGREGGES